jgi:TolB-like protein/DNA-binding winged helix-turn-helix (wHTH) protein/Flp pilus assembly protein TadD
MDPSLPKPMAARFGLFEADFEQRILTKGGLRIKLQDQPFQVLAMLLERQGELVTREDIRHQLWPADTFVEFDDGLNTAIKKLRAALNDSADNPRFIETVPRRGYRFLAPVTTQVPVHQTEAAEAQQGSPSDFATPASTQDIAPSVTSSGISSNPAPAPRHWARSWPIIAVVSVALCIAALSSFLFKPGVFSRRPFASERATLIVIPLDNLSGDPQQEYFSDGITEEITTQLARLDPDRLGIIGRLTAMRYKHSGKDIAQIGREIPVQYVLEGSVRREQTRIRVTVQLIEVANQTHVWAEEYDRDLSDALGLQRDIASAVAGKIKLKLTPEQEHHLSSGAPATAEAHDAYLKGRYEWNKRTEEGFHSAIKYFEEVLQIQPDYAPAYTGLADSYNLLGQYGFARQDEAYPKAKVYAQKAVQLDGTLAEAYTALADVEIKYDRDWRGGERDFVRAIQLNANYATAHLWYAEDYLTFAGKLEQAIAEAKKAQEIEPLSPIVGTVVAETYFVARDYDQAIRQAKTVLEMEPTFVPALVQLGWAYEQKGMFPEAIAEFQKGVEISHGSFAYGMKVHLAHAYALSGKKSEARKILSELFAESRRQYFPPCSIAIIYTALGEKDSALEWLERCGQTENLPNLRVDPRFDSLRTEKRFQELVRKSSPN